MLEIASSGARTTFGHWINPVPPERMASGQSLESQPSAPHDSEPPDRFLCVIRAGRVKPATGTGGDHVENGRNQQPVNLDEPDKKGLQGFIEERGHLQEHREESWVMSLRKRASSS